MNACSTFAQPLLHPHPDPPDLPPRIPLQNSPNDWNIGLSSLPGALASQHMTENGDCKPQMNKKQKRKGKVSTWKKLFCASDRNSSVNDESNEADENDFDQDGPCPLRNPVLPARQPLDSAPPIPPRLPLSHRPYNLNHSIQQLLLDNVPWYWGSLRLKDANRLLEAMAPGTFLVRDSSSLHFVFSVSYQTASQKPFHCHVEYSNCLFRLSGTVPVLSDSLAGLIWSLIQKINKRSIFFSAPRHSRPGVAPSPVTFASYVSRFEVCPSLKYLSRIAVKQSVSPAELDQLPVPASLLQYLKECPFYDSELVENILKHRTEAKLKAGDGDGNISGRT